MLRHGRPGPHQQQGRRVVDWRYFLSDALRKATVWRWLDPGQAAVGSHHVECSASPISRPASGIAACAAVSTDLPSIRARGASHHSTIVRAPLSSIGFCKVITSSATMRPVETLNCYLERTRSLPLLQKLLSRLQLILATAEHHF